ncbi:hypothetical protein T492DRAFT_317976 [Pavlovales sp. CCMP2436]|nr:hypothetical protein T492DRAFT_317976 [Pavlovales sp. CCMP2436]
MPICLYLLASGECLGMAHLSGPSRRRTPGSRRTPRQRGRPRRCRRAQRCRPLSVRRAAIGPARLTPSEARGRLRAVRALAEHPPRARQGEGAPHPERGKGEAGGLRAGYAPSPSKARKGRASPRARQGEGRERSERWLRTLPERGKGRARLTSSEASGRPRAVCALAAHPP